MESEMKTKRAHGQYFTQRNIFDHQAFRNWAERAGLPDACVLEPFAGANSLIEMLQELGLCCDFRSYDVLPKSSNVAYRDTLVDFPKGFHAVVTNPPYLAKNSATRQGIELLDKRYDDLYKYALLRCLENTPYIGAIIPASFLNAGLFQDRLTTYIALPYEDMFIDTEHPVCLALFEPLSQGIEIFEKDSFLGLYDDLKKHLPAVKKEMNIVFNHPQGNLSLRAVDGTKEPTIAFMEGDAVKSERIKHSSRNLSRIMVEGSFDIENLNAMLNELRLKTADIFFTPFKGIRSDGRFRRRIDFTLARNFILSLI